MSRNTLKNVKKHNDDLHNQQKKKTVKRLERKETLKSIVRKFNEKKEKSVL